MVTASNISFWFDNELISTFYEVVLSAGQEVQGVMKLFPSLTLTANSSFYPKILSHEVLYKREQQTHISSKGFVHPLGSWFNSTRWENINQVRLHPLYFFDPTQTRLDKLDQVWINSLDFCFNYNKVEGTSSPPWLGLVVLDLVWLHPLGLWFNSDQVRGSTWDSGSTLWPLVHLQPGFRSWFRSRFDSTPWTFSSTLRKL